VRFHDRKGHVLIYLSSSDRWLTGSSKKSISTVPVMPRPQADKAVVTHQPILDRTFLIWLVIGQNLLDA